MDKQSVLEALQKQRDNYGINFGSKVDVEDVLDLIILSKKIDDPYYISKKIDAIMKKMGFSQKTIDKIIKSAEKGDNE